MSGAPDGGYTVPRNGCKSEAVGRRLSHATADPCLSGMTTTQHGFGNRPAAGSKRYACICGHVVKGATRAEAFRRLEAHIAAEAAPARTPS